MPDDLEMRRRRAAYRASHRGTKEMDIILGRYAEARLGAMAGEELSAFERFLALPDPLLTQWFSSGATGGRRRRVCRIDRSAARAPRIGAGICR